MTEPDRYGEEVRRALSAAAELVVPAGDGLDIIRKRAARRPPVLAWLLAYVSYLPRQLATRVRVMASELAVMAKGESDLLLRMRAGLRSRAGQARPTQAWLRPGLAAAAALLLVVAVALAVPPLRETITNQANNGPGGGPGGGGGSTGHALGHGARSAGASDSATDGFRSSGMRPPMLGGGTIPKGILFLTLPGAIGGTVPNPCVTSTPEAAAESAGTASDATTGAPSDPQGSGSHAGAAYCTPTTPSSPTTPTSPTSTPPSSPTSTPPSSPTSTPPSSPTSTPPSSPTSTPPTSTSAAPTEGSTSSTPPEYPTASSGS